MTLEVAPLRKSFVAKFTLVRLLLSMHTHVVEKLKEIIKNGTTGMANILIIISAFDYAVMGLLIL